MPFVPCPKPVRQPKQAKPRPTRSKRSARSGGHLFPHLVKSSRRAFIRRQRCIATGCKTGEWVLAQAWMPATLQALCPYKARIVAAHVKPGRGAGGLDAGNMVPLEWALHDLVGVKTWAWLERAARLMSVRELAEMFEARYLAKQTAIAKNVNARGARRPEPA